MGLEIERKFLLTDNSWRDLSDSGTVIKQGYLNTHPERTVRIRIKGNKGILTVKGKNVKNTRLECEYEIPLDDALEMMKICEQPIIEKTRFIVQYNNLTWEIDEFEGDNIGLTVAEVELESEDQQIELPSWVGEEVSSDRRYYNSSLIRRPFKDW